MQTTISQSVSFSGVGLHFGHPARLTLMPAPADCGIVFRRVDLPPGRGGIPALWHLVEKSPLCTRLVNDHGVSVSMVEHVMAALMGCGVHNAVVAVDHAECPILDGSAGPFVRAMRSVGLRALPAPVRVLQILKPVEVRRGDAHARLSPYPALHMDFGIDFEDSAIGRQRKSLSLANGGFVRDLADARTFCRKADVNAMRARGLALGGTLDNAVVFDGARVLSPGGLRHTDEAVRHKMLDALGDLGLAGYPILGRYRGRRAGHAVTNDLLHALFARPDHYRIVVCDAMTATRLPGAGLHGHDIANVA